MAIISDRVVINTIIGKNKAMMCTPGLTWGKQGVAEYKRRETWEGSIFRGWNKTRVSCEEFRTMMEASLLRHHMEHAHRTDMPHTWEVDVGGGGTDTYVV